MTPTLILFTACCALLMAGEDPVPVTVTDKPPVAIPAGKYLGSVWGGKAGRVVADDPLFGTLFTQITPTNAGKWQRVEPERGKPSWDVLDALFRDAARDGVLVKYHGFVWGQQQPKWTEKDPAIAEAIDGWIDAAFDRYGDRMAMIDVVNEPLNAPALYRAWIPGGDGDFAWVAWVYERARHHQRRTGSPAKLLLNEWGQEKLGAKRVQPYKRLAQMLKDRGLIDGIGLQAHFLEKTKPARVQETLDELATVGLPLHISEFDIDIEDDRKQADQFGALFTVFHQHPAVAGITLWGHREGGMWSRFKWAHLIRMDGTPRPAFTWMVEYLATHGRPELAGITPGTPLAPE